MTLLLTLCVNLFDSSHIKISTLFIYICQAFPCCRRYCCGFCQRQLLYRMHATEIISLSTCVLFNVERQPTHPAKNPFCRVSEWQIVSCCVSLVSPQGPHPCVNPWICAVFTTIHCVIDYVWCGLMLRCFPTKIMLLLLASLRVFAKLEKQNQNFLFRNFRIRMFCCKGLLCFPYPHTCHNMTITKPRKHTMNFQTTAAKSLRYMCFWV